MSCYSSRIERKIFCDGKTRLTKYLPFLERSENITSLASNEQLIQMYGSSKELVKELTTFFFYGIVSHPKHP